jgi:hypothetical protein
MSPERCQHPDSPSRLLARQEVRERMTIVFEMLEPWGMVLTAGTVVEAGYSFRKTTKFAHTIVHKSGRVMIRSSCTQCGASNIVSIADGSLQVWENEHVCERVLIIEEPDYSN